MTETEATKPTNVPLTIDELLAPRKWPVKRFVIKALGRACYIREVTAGERDHMEGLALYARQRPQMITGRFRATYVAYFLSDRDGNRLVSDTQIGEIDKLSQGAINEIYEAGMAFNALDEETEKN